MSKTHYVIKIRKLPANAIAYFALIILAFVFMIWSGTWQASASLSSGLLANIYLNKLINGDDE